MGNIWWHKLKKSDKFKFIGFVFNHIFHLKFTERNIDWVQQITDTSISIYTKIFVSSFLFYCRLINIKRTFPIRSYKYSFNGRINTIFYQWIFHFFKLHFKSIYTCYSLKFYFKFHLFDSTVRMFFLPNRKIWIIKNYLKTIDLSYIWKHQ
jgi:hypothetical protein